MKSVWMASISFAALFWGNSLCAQSSDKTLTEDEGVEIIVTGEKAYRSIQDTQSSVAVTTAPKIDAENIQTLYDVINRTANMSEAMGPMGFTIRGISNQNVSGGGTAPLATVYVDGAALPSRALFAGPLDMWDIGQVEVFRGPQSTIQGKNALAGAVMIRSKDPAFDYEAKGRVIMSDQGDRTLAVAVGGPLLDDQLAFRLSAEKRDATGYVYNPTRGEDEAPYNGLSTRAKWLYRPAALSGFSLLATYAHHEATTGYIYNYVRTDTPDYFSNPVNTSNRPNTTDNAIDIFTVEGRYVLNDHWAMAAVVSHNRLVNQLDYDLDNTALDISYGAQSVRANTFSQELRLNYDGAAFNGLIGLYHSDRKTTTRSAARTTVITPVYTIIGGLMASGFDQDTAAYVAGLYASALPVVPVQSVSNSPETVENVALFADGTWRITPRLSLFGGLRYDRETYGIATTQAAVFVGAYPNPADYPDYLQPAIFGINALVGQSVAAANASAPAALRRFEAWLPKLGLNYDFDPSKSLSFTLQRGYRSGGAGINLARATVVPFNPEYTTNYELAWRSAWLDDTVTVNANAYVIDWTDQQVNVFMGLNEFDYETKNAGSSHLYGFELEVAQRVGDHLDWYASIGHARTEYDAFTVEQGMIVEDYEGNEFAYAPRWTLSGGVTWRGKDGIFANINGSYRGETYQDMTNDVRLKSRTLINTKIGYESKQWAAYINGTNLLGAKYRQHYRPADNLALIGAPRTVGLILEARY